MKTFSPALLYPAFPLFWSGLAVAYVKELFNRMIIDSYLPLELRARAAITTHQSRDGSGGQLPALSTTGTVASI